MFKRNKPTFKNEVLVNDFSVSVSVIIIRRKNHPVNPNLIREAN